MALDAATSGQFACGGAPACHGQDTPDGVGVGRIALLFQPLADRTRRKDSWSACERNRIGGVDVAGRELEELVVGPEQVGGAVEQHGDVAFGDVVEERQQFVADPVAPESGVVVGGIIGDRETELCAEGVRLGSSDPQDRVAPSGSDRAEPGGSRPSEQRKEQRLGLVVGRVARQSVRAECRPPSRSRSRLEIGSLFDLDVNDVERDAELHRDHFRHVGVVVC